MKDSASILFPSVQLLVQLTCMWAGSLGPRPSHPLLQRKIGKTHFSNFSL